jgi:hypothetical protein
MGRPGGTKGGRQGQRGGGEHRGIRRPCQHVKGLACPPHAKLNSPPLDRPASRAPDPRRERRGRETEGRVLRMRCTLPQIRARGATRRCGGAMQSSRLDPRLCGAPTGVSAAQAPMGLRPGSEPTTAATGGRCRSVAGGGWRAPRTPADAPTTMGRPGATGRMLRSCRRCHDTPSRSTPQAPPGATLKPTPSKHTTTGLASRSMSAHVGEGVHVVVGGRHPPPKGERVPLKLQRGGQAFPWTP